MPLTEQSKTKVGLASLSGTTAAAAESLWARSKKSSKKKQASQATTEDKASVPPAVPTSLPVAPVTLPSPDSNNSVLLQQQERNERYEFRRRFLDALQFYCENSSLILNSDLPADLIEFVTSHGFSVESLGIILELKKSSSAFSACIERRTPSNKVIEAQHASDKQPGEQNYSEASRRLLQHWMSADSCAEAFVSLSLGEEIPGLIAEVVLAFHTLTHGIKSFSESTSKEEQEQRSQIRTQVLATFLDRIFTRYFNDSEHFYGFLNENGELLWSDYELDPFQNFMGELTSLGEKEAIGRRLISKTLLHLSSNSSLKFSKALFVHQNDTTASLVLSPSFEFTENNAQWKFVMQNLPVKIVTKSKVFWMSWATYIERESKCYLEFWKTSVEHWIVLNKSTLVDEHSLYSATLAVVALARQIKCNRTDAQDGKVVSKIMSQLELGKILENIVSSLESINVKKRACGMALGQIVSDIHISHLTKFASPEDKSELKRLNFESKSPMFLEIIAFYEKGICMVTHGQPSNLQKESVVPGPNTPRKIEVLDSDDDAEDETTGELPIDEFPILGDHDEQVGIDPRILTLRARNRKIPSYFSEIVEVLLESSKNEDEAEILRCIVILKIPVLMFVGVRIDGRMATTICRCLLDMEDSGSLKIPLLMALYELFVQHPFEIADSISQAIFNRNSYTVGQRQMNLTRLTHIMSLASKQSCFNCFSKPLDKHEKELLGIYPEFIQKYMDGRKKFRFCQQCRGSSPGIPQTGDHSEAVSHKSKNSSKPLTWQQIVDQRVAKKTKYFVTPKSKTRVVVPDDYSSKFLPIFWSSIGNRLTSAAPFYLDIEERVRSGAVNDAFLDQVFQYMASCILGTRGSSSPHLRNIASHAGELVAKFFHHEDALVRRAVLNLLGMTLSVGEGKSFVIEALSSQGNIVKLVNTFLESERDSENRRILQDIEKFVAGCSVASFLDHLKQQNNSSTFSKLQILDVE